MGLRRGLMAAVIGGGDPYWGSVASLLHFDGANNSTTFTDEKGKAWTRSNTNPKISTASSVFGGASGYFPGSSAGSISTPHHADYDFGSGDFTVEGWVYITNSSNNNSNAIVCHDSIGGTRGWLFLRSDNTTSPAKTIRFACLVGATAYLVVDPSAPDYTQPIYYAAVRDGSTLRLYRAGVQLDSVAISGSIGNPSVPCVVGELYGTSGVLASTQHYGYIDELRITKGVCRYPSGTSFTPPALAFPNN